jgi:tetratricopeptide (TPR) repeat protein
MKKFLFSALFVCLAWSAQAQSQKAFAASYTAEYAGNIAKAIEEIKGVHQSSSYETNIRLGWLYYSAQSYSESAKYYKAACDLMKMSIESRLGYVLPLSALGKWDEVITVYKEIIAIEKYNSTANYRLALIYYNRKDYNTAKSYIDNALNVYPFDYDTVILAAWTYQMVGKREAARSLFEKALLLRPNDASAMEGLKN